MTYAVVLNTVMDTGVYVRGKIPLAFNQSDTKLHVLNTSIVNDLEDSNRTHL